MDADVVVCGLGPVGQLLSLLLGDLGVRTVAVDGADGPYDLPRAAVVDDEVLRIFQAAGVVDDVLAAAQVQRAVTFVTHRGRPIEVLAPDARSAFGHPQLASIHQPSLERALLAALASRGTADVRWRRHVDAVEQDAGGVTVVTRPAGGPGGPGGGEPLRARFAVACDGAGSPIRTRLGIPFGGSTFAQRWLVVDTTVDRPLRSAPHPHFVGDVRRPVVSLPMSPGRHRWEWMLHPGEDEAPFLDRPRIRELLAPWIADESVEVERAVVYTFHARTAARWRAERILLAGDAAHVMPPFVGQGFSSGARDAANLAWKLRAVLDGAPDALLDSYEAERRPHVRAMQALAVRWGGIVQTRRPAVGAVRDVALGLVDRSGLARVIREHAKPRPRYRRGAFGPGGGALFPQPGRLDDALGSGWAVVSCSAAVSAAWARLGHHVVTVEDPALLGRASWALLRPDRYVFARGHAGDIAAADLAHRRLLGRSAPSSPPTPQEPTLR